MGNNTDTAAAVNTVQAAKTEAEPAFSRAQILAAKRYSNRRDALSVVLEDDRLYTDAQIAAALKNYYGREVK